MSDELRRLLPLVKRVARRLAARLPASVELDDLVQCGWIAVSDAMARYTEEGGASFETYATHRARGAMLDALRADDPLSRSERRDRRAMHATVTSLEHKLGREPRRSEIAASLGWDDERMRNAETQPTPVELDEARDAAVADPLAGLLEHERERLMQAEIARLPDRKREILRLVGEGELTGHEIGVLYGITPSRVSQIAAEAVALLAARLADPPTVAAAAVEPAAFRAGSLVG